MATARNVNAPIATSGVAQLRGIEVRKNKKPQQAPIINSGKRASGLNRRTLSHVRLFDSSLTYSTPSGMKIMYAMESERVTARHASAIIFTFRLPHLVRRANNNGNSK